MKHSFMASTIFLFKTKMLPLPTTSYRDQFDIIWKNALTNPKR